MQAIIGPENKCFFFPDGATERPAKVVAAERWQSLAAAGSGSIEVVCRVKDVISEKFKHGPVERVRPALTHHHGLASHGHPIFGAERIGQDPVLANPLYTQRRTAY